jgi:hypothetical protein
VHGLFVAASPGLGRPVTMPGLPGKAGPRPRRSRSSARSPRLDHRRDCRGVLARRQSAAGMNVENVPVPRRSYGHQPKVVDSRAQAAAPSPSDLPGHPTSIRRRECRRPGTAGRFTRCPRHSPRRRPRPARRSTPTAPDCSSISDRQHGRRNRDRQGCKPHSAAETSRQHPEIPTIAEPSEDSREGPESPANRAFRRGSSALRSRRKSPVRIRLGVLLLLSRWDGGSLDRSRSTLR